MNTYTDELKAQVIADLLIGTATIKQIADKHNVPYSTVTTWNNRLVKNSEMAVIETDETQIKKRIGDLLLEILEVNLETQIAQLRHFADKEWLMKQSASEIGILHGIQVDKAVRMISIFKDGNST